MRTLRSLYAVGVAALCIIGIAATLAVRGYRAARLNKALLEAADEGNLAKVRTLLAEGADVNAKDDNEQTADMTPLHFAAERGDKDVAELLLGKGADVNAKDSADMTPLHCAASCHHEEVAELLLAKGADVNARCFNGVTPLHWAVVRGCSKEFVRLLLARGADVNVKEAGPFGATPLDRAVRLDRGDIADLLREHGGTRGRELDQ